MKENYIATQFLIEELNELFLESINKTISGLEDINSSRSLLLYKIGRAKNPIMFQDFIRQHRRYSHKNLSGNLNILERRGYISFEEPALDRRVRIFGLSSKGKELFKKIEEDFSSNVKSLIEIGCTEEKLKTILDSLYDLQEFWLKKNMNDTISITRNKKY